MLADPLLSPPSQAPNFKIITRLWTLAKAIEGVLGGCSPYRAPRFRSLHQNMVFGIKQSRLEKLAGTTRSLLSQGRWYCQLVESSLLHHFTGVAISWSLAMPLARFYTRSISDYMAGCTTKPVRLTHNALRDLKEWWGLTSALYRSHLQRCMHPTTSHLDLALHSHASTSIGSGGTLGANLGP